ncbi:prenyltransferase [Ectothiorhodospira variabilis]|uniref:prenyltransferase n=1 Tax=Ectothiorhodospira variabilis TaxID=505694 RepID=UPI001EFAEB1A|nr:prenyltransferase [Ectothiorhodospira variabilis]MCG5498741.1 prenyltransferase [Ectothiorhodospira variabilis]
MKPAGSYDFIRAMRPFTFSVAIAACGLGTVLALHQGYGSIWLALLIIGAGILLQAAVNLINDHADLPLLEEQAREVGAAHQEQYRAAISAIRRNFRWGMTFLGFAFLIGLGLVWVQGWLLLVLIIVGLLGAYFYSGEPVHYKRRGLGVILVFWLMGVLLVGGSAVAMGAPLTVDVLLISIPFSLLTSLVLLGNELRDHAEDERHGLRTLTVRIGEWRARQLFGLMLGAVYASSLLLWWGGLLPWAWHLALSLPLAWPPLRAAWQAGADRSQLPQQTGRLFAGFGLLFLMPYLARLF